MSEDHEVRKHHETIMTPEEADEKQSARESEMLDKFKWHEDNAVIDGDPHPLEAEGEEIIACVTAICEYAFNSLSAEHYDDIRFTIPIPTNCHNLIETHFDVTYNEESRYKFFVILKYVCQQMMEDEYLQKLQLKVLQFLPGQFSISKLELIDDLITGLSEEPDKPKLDVIISLDL